jgi:cell division protein FtsB
MNFLKNTLKNKYFLVITGFLVWMIFFDEKDWKSVSAKKSRLDSLQRTQQEMDAKIAATKAELYQLQSNAKNLEKYARDKYMMKKNNEDVFQVDMP